MICYFIRHGKDDESVRGGWSLSGLVDEEKEQVKNLTEYIIKTKNELKIDKVFSSDLPRAIETAKPISEILNIQFELTPEFREINNGVFAGMPNNIANEKYPGIFWNTLEWDEPYPVGESPKFFYNRIKNAWDSFSNRIIKDEKNVILVTHSGVMHVIFSIIDGTIFSNKDKFQKIPHAIMIPLIYENGIWRH